MENKFGLGLNGQLLEGSLSHNGMLYTNICRYLAIASPWYRLPTCLVSFWRIIFCWKCYLNWCTKKPSEDCCLSNFTQREILNILHLQKILDKHCKYFVFILCVVMCLNVFWLQTLNYDVSMVKLWFKLRNQIYIIEKPSPYFKIGVILK